jgi:hypothetical protein
LKHHSPVLAFVYQSPNFEKSFTTLALAYDPSTSVTSGFLGYVYSKSTEDLIKSLISAKAQAMHPLLLPILCLNNWIYILRRETYAQDAQLRNVQHLTGMMERSTNSDADRSKDFLSGDSFHAAHATIVVMHNVLANSLVSFIQESRRDIKLALAKIRRMISTDNTIIAGINVEFENCVEQIDMVAIGLIHMRQRLLTRMDMQLKVVSLGFSFAFQVTESNADPTSSTILCSSAIAESVRTSPSSLQRSPWRASGTALP